MKNQPSVNTIKKRRQVKLNKLGLCGPFVTGSLNRVEKKDKHGKVTVYHLLTFKEEGKTRSVYVPKDLVKEVQSWIRNHRRVKQLMSEVSTMSIAIIRSHVSQKRTSAPGAGAKPRAKQNNP